MVKSSKLVKCISFIISAISGIFIGYKTYEAPVSTSIFKIRVFIIIFSLLIVILAIIGQHLIQRYNVNDEFVIDDEMLDYFIDTKSKFKTSMIGALIIGPILLLITVFGTYHAPVMLIVCIGYYFILTLMFILPAIEGFIEIIKMIIDYTRIQSSRY